LVWNGRYTDPVEFDDLSQGIRQPDTGANGDEQEHSGVTRDPIRGAGIAPNAITELVADLLETTGLIPPDRLAQARSRAGIGRSPGRSSTRRSGRGPA